jgi:hypothetical protein
MGAQAELTDGVATVNELVIQVIARIDVGWGRLRLISFSRT